MRTERIEAPRRFVVTGRYEWTGDQDIEVELTPATFRWRFAGEARFREATWNQIPATLDGMLDVTGTLNSMFRRRPRPMPQRAALGPGDARAQDPGPTR